jgi:hypothetical protein
MSARAGQEMGLLSVLERFELSHAASQPDLLRRGVNKIDRHQMTCLSPMLRFHNEVRQRAGDWIDDHAFQLAADAVIARDFAANGELSGFADQGCLSSRRHQ